MPNTKRSKSKSPGGRSARAAGKSRSSAGTRASGSRRSAGAKPSRKPASPASPPAAEAPDGTDDGPSPTPAGKPAGVLVVDPNVGFATRVVRVTLGTWDHRAVLEARVGGNCRGLDVFGTAVEDLFDNRLEKGPEFTDDETGKTLCPRRLTLTDPKGGTLLMDEIVNEDELKDLVVAVELVGVEPDAAD